MGGGVTATLSAGAAQAVITPPLGLEMAGYIRRGGPAEAVLDDLRCRVVVLDDGSTRLAIVSFDLLYVSAGLTRRVRDHAADVLGMPGEHVMVVATHTHCGPGSLAGERAPELLDAIAGRARTTLAEAAAALRPARLLVGSTEVPGIARNRRDPPGCCDELARVVAVVDARNRESIATLVNFACHPTILEHDTRAYSADFPGAACAAVERLWGGVAVFLQGCAADVNPVFLDHTHGECRRVGTIVGAAAGRVVGELKALLGQPRTINLSWDEELSVTAATRGREVVTDRLRAATAAISATRRSPVDAAEVADELAELRALVERAGDAGERRAVGPRVAELWAEDLVASGVDVVGDVDPPEIGAAIGVQAFRLGARLLVMALPGEPFSATGVDLHRAAEGDLLALGYANQSVGYLPPAAEFPHRGYEVGRSMYEAGTVERLAAAAKRIMDELTTAPETHP
jgi:neutral ceramidase